MVAFGHEITLGGISPNPLRSIPGVERHPVSLCHLWGKQGQGGEGCSNACVGTVLTSASSLSSDSHFSVASSLGLSLPPA